MGSTQDKGAEGEAFAKNYLLGLGYTFIRANWGWKTGEIDLIFDDKKTRVFVEVRARSVTTFGQGLDTVFWQKQQKIIKTARMYQVKENYWGDARFDVVSVTFNPAGKHTVEHIQDAFDTQSI